MRISDWSSDVCSSDLLLKGTASLAMVLQAGLWMGGVIDFWIAKSRARALQENAGAATSLGALNFIAKVALWTMLLLLGLDNLGVDVPAMVAGLGCGGLAVALGVQNRSEARREGKGGVR